MINSSFKPRNENHLIVIAFLLLIPSFTSAAFAPLSTTARNHPRQSSFPYPTASNTGIFALYDNVNNENGPSNNNNNNKKASASDLEKQREESRRTDRLNDVVIGKTSARTGEKDYPITPDRTARQYLDGLSDTSVEAEVYRETERGMNCLRMLQLEEAKEAFGRVYLLKPDAYLWQAGVVHFYLDEIHAAAECFAKNAVTYELKFGEPASEERIWRDACELKLLNPMSRKDRKLARETEFIPVVGEYKGEEGSGREVRRVLRIARDLFSCGVCEDKAGAVLARAKLRSICYNRSSTDDRKMWKMNSSFYLGLYHDALGEKEESKECMKMALRHSLGGLSSEDFTHCLPVIHMSKRDWYDDEEFNKGETPPTNDGIVANTDSILIASLSEGVEKMKLTEIQDALKKRGVKGIGNKGILQDRLVNSLLQECGSDYDQQKTNAFQ